MPFRTEKSGGLSSNPVLGPEWLAKDPHKEKERELTLSDDVPNPNPSNGSQSPRTLGRSRSQPLFEDVPTKESNDVNGFSLIQERSTFDRNFPTLNAASRKSSAGQSTANAWNQPNKVSPARSPVGTITPPSEEETPAPRLRHSTGNTRDSTVYHPPVPAPPKPARTRELVTHSIYPEFTRQLLPSKKKDNPKIPRHFDMSILRKATSDPNLPITGEYGVAMPIKMPVAAPVKKKEKPSNAGSATDANLHTNSDRNDFFQDLIRKEAQMKKQEGNGGMRTLTMSSDSNVNKQEEEEESKPSVPPPPIQQQQQQQEPEVASTTITEAAPSSRKKSTSFSIEDEERFLKDLGWEDSNETIPEITNEEILAIKNMLISAEKNKKVNKWPPKRPVHVL